MKRSLNFAMVGAIMTIAILVIGVGLAALKLTAQSAFAMTMMPGNQTCGKMMSGNATSGIMMKGNETTPPTLTGSRDTSPKIYSSPTTFYIYITDILCSVWGLQ